MTLIPETELIAAAERIQQRQVAKTAAPSPTPAPVAGFVYEPRTAKQWERRIRQDYRSNRTFRPKVTKPAKPLTAREKGPYSEPIVAPVGIAATDSIPETVLADDSLQPRKARKKKAAIRTAVGQRFSIDTTEPVKP